MTKKPEKTAAQDVAEGAPRRAKARTMLPDHVRAARDHGKGVSLEVHVIQTLPPSRVNRGKDGQPKTATMGGVPRARLSSQSQKFRQRNTVTTPRTRIPHVAVLRHLVALGGGDVHDQDLQGLVMDLMESRYGPYENGMLKVATYLSQEESAQFARLAHARLGELQDLRTASVVNAKDKAAAATYKDALEEVLNGYRPGMSDDVSLYGRFMADLPEERVTAATSYGHGLSVGRDNTAQDFFSAVDSETGESMHIGDIGLNAPTFYRFAMLDLRQLQRNLARADILATVREWVHGFMSAVPLSGGHGAYANTLPEHVMLVLRVGGQAITLGNAFTVAAYPSGEETLLAAAVRKLHAQHHFNRRAFAGNGQEQVAVVSALYPAAADGYLGSPERPAVGAESIDAALDLLLDDAADLYLPLES